MYLYNVKKYTIMLVFTACVMYESSSHPPSAVIGVAVKKHVVGARPYGLFSNFLAVLNHIDWSLRNNHTPVVYWIKPCTYYTGKIYNGSHNAWEYYFEPVSSLEYKPNDTIHNDYCAPDGSHIYWIFNAQTQPSKSKRQDIYERIIKPFIKLNPIVQAKVDTFFENHMTGKHTIGIHLRGTDKQAEVKQVPPLQILTEAQRQAKPDSQFFIATDEEALLELARTTLKDKIIYYDSQRSKDGRAIHFDQPFPMNILGEEVIIEAMLLARCDKIIHTCSNVSTAVLFLNPEIENILMSAT